MTVVDSMAVPSVLIAEPDPWSRDLLKHVVLSVRCDAQLDVCEEGQQALRLLSQNTYDLVIADGDLPGVGAGLAAYGTPAPSQSGTAIYLAEQP